MSTMITALTRLVLSFTLLNLDSYSSKFIRETERILSIIMRRLMNLLAQWTPLLRSAWLVPRVFTELDCVVREEVSLLLCWSKRTFYIHRIGFSCYGRLSLLLCFSFMLSFNFSRKTLVGPKANFIPFHNLCVCVFFFLTTGPTRVVATQVNFSMSAESLFFLIFVFSRSPKNELYVTVTQ